MLGRDPGAASVGDGRQATFAQIAELAERIRLGDPTGRVRLWYDKSGPDGLAYDAVAAQYLLCPRMVSGSFPRIENRVLCDGAPFVAGQPVVVLSGRSDVREQADRSLAELGLRGAGWRREPSLGPLAGAQLWFFTAEPLAAEFLLHSR